MREDSKLTIAEAAELSGMPEAALRARFEERATRGNGVTLALARPHQGPPLPAEASPEQAREVQPDQSEPGMRLTLELVEHLERQAAEIAELRATAGQAESLTQELVAQRAEREELQAKLDAARSELESLKSSMAGLRGRQDRRLMVESELVRTQADLEAAKAQLAEQTSTWRAWLPRAGGADSRRPRRTGERTNGRGAVETQLAEARKDVEEAHRRIATLEQRDRSREKLQEQLAAAQSELEAARERIAELEHARRSWRGLFRP